VAKELPKMLAGLRALQRSYPLLQAVVEDSGEHVLSGTGELYLDCAMHDLRERYARGVEVKVSDPAVALTETVAEPSSIRSFADAPNGRTRLYAAAGPVEPALARDLELRAVPPPSREGGRALERALRKQYGYDVLAARSVWAFGPDDVGGTNVLLDDTLLDDKSALLDARDRIVQGFRWAAREGPLCGEPMRGVKLRLLDAQLDARGLQRGAGEQIIPTARRVTFASVMTAQPRLAEPVYRVEAVAFSDAAGAVRAALRRRRGDVTGETRVPGTPLSRVRGFVPVLDSFGLETDVRVQTRGRAFLEASFDSWRVVPGDPLDESVRLRPLEASLPEQLARELVVKTRRRKGLPESVSASDYMDPDMLLELVRVEQLQMQALHQQQLQQQQQQRQGGDGAGDGGGGRGNGNGAPANGARLRDDR